MLIGIDVTKAGLVVTVRASDREARRRRAPQPRHDGVSQRDVDLSPEDARGIIRHLRDQARQ